MDSSGFVSNNSGAKVNSEERILTPVRVWRGGPGETGHYDTFLTPYEEGMSVLDALRWIRLHADSSLAIRYSCINANACKTCMVLVDGKVEYACTSRLKPAGVSLEPLRKRRVIRDLVTDTIPDEEKLERTVDRNDA
jgi:succinate dehydrogenase/fumarate reductase-like Fe-S protein